MNYLSVENISKSFGERTLFTNVTFGLDKGQKTALVARNGTGKTTILRILSDRETADSGNVTFRRDIEVGILDQEPDLPLESTVMDAVLNADNPVVKAVKAYEIAVENPEDVEALQTAMEQMDRLEAWDYEVRIREVLSKLSVDMMDRKIGQLSGGQRKRVAMAKLLISEPDIMILDEPTNHLDLEMIEWLEEFLMKFTGALLMVTHDRYFLDRVCTEIIEMEDQTLYRHKGNYSYYLENKAIREEVASVTREKAQNLMRTELEWMRRMPKARTTKSKARIDSFYDLKEAARKKREEGGMSIDINMERLGGKILEFHKLSKAFPQHNAAGEVIGDLKLVDNFNYKFKRQDRVGIVGRNGTGKTTFLNMLLGTEPLDSGKIVHGETVKFGYYAQDGIELKDDKRVIEVVRDVGEFIPLAKGRKLSAADLLERFMFSRDQQWTMVKKLSGGEKRRLYLLTILMRNPNVLIMDEPTNDLDILTLNVLEDFLLDFPGCLIIVTHDRYFMDKLVDHLFVFEGDGVIRDFPGNYTQYREWLLEQKVEERQAPKAQPEPVKQEQKKPDSPKKKFGFNEKREFEKLEKDIPALEKRKEELTEFLNSGTTDHEELLAKGNELGKIIKDLEAKSDRWLELSELA